MKRECPIVGDLLPLYLEHMVSAESAELVESHLRECEVCRAEYESLRRGEAVPCAAEEGNGLRPFRRLMKRIRRPISALAYGLTVLFVFFGFSLTAGEDMLYNGLIMPIVGAFCYAVFRRAALYKMPLLLLGVDLAAWALGMAEISLAEAFLWTLLYGALALAGALCAGLLHYAFRKEIKEDEK